MTCPNCGSRLSRLFTSEHRPPRPTNEYACLLCPYGLNRWELVSGELRNLIPATVSKGPTSHFAPSDEEPKQEATQYLADSAWGIHYAAAEDRLKEAEADAPVLG